MQLLAAHLVLIGSAIALAVLFGLRALVHFSREGATTDLVLAAASLVAAGALAMYFRTVRSKWLAERSGQGQPRK